MFLLKKLLSALALPPLSLILLITATWSYREAVTVAGENYDRSLTIGIRVIADRLRASGNAVVPSELADVLFYLVRLAELASVATARWR